MWEWDLLLDVDESGLRTALLFAASHLLRAGRSNGDVDQCDGGAGEALEETDCAEDASAQDGSEALTALESLTVALAVDRGDRGALLLDVSSGCREGWGGILFCCCDIPERSS